MTEQCKITDAAAVAYRTGLTAVGELGGKYTPQEITMVCVVAARLWIGEAVTQIMMDTNQAPEAVIHDVAALALDARGQALIVKVIRENLSCPARH